MRLILRPARLGNQSLDLERPRVAVPSRRGDCRVRRDSTLQGPIREFPRHRPARLGGQVFEVGESRAPRRTVRAGEFVGRIFGHPVEVGLLDLDPLLVYRDEDYQKLSGTGK
jgi:hypothetical protein